MKAPPPGWPRLSASVCYRDTRAAIDFLVDAFGFEVRTRVVNERGAVQHAELTLGEAVIMPFDESPEADRPWKRQRQLLLVYVDDVDAHCARARGGGAQILEEPADHDFGPEAWADRMYAAADPEGQVWFFAQRLRTGRGGDGSPG